MSIRSNEYQTEILDIEQLEFFDFREIRDNLINDLMKRIQETGYNPSRPLSVVKSGEKYLVADGNHRLKTIKMLKIKKIPCIVYNTTTDPYLIASLENQDENTYAPLDLFDWLHAIKKLKQENLTQQKIGEKIGWSRDLVTKYDILLNKIVTPILNLCKLHQTGRVTKNVTLVTFDFSEGWFRTSGLYDLQAIYQKQDNYQVKCVKEFITDKCNWSKAKLQQETAKYKFWQTLYEIAHEKLVNQDDLAIILELIENNQFKTVEQLEEKIRELNKEAKSFTKWGDALILLEELKDASLNVIITDPPYGEDYISHRSKFTEHVTKKGIINDEEKEALELLKKTCEILNRKTKQDAHLYIFTSWKKYPFFKEIISKYFTIRNLIIWDKLNHGAGDLENAWGNRYEMIVFATKGDRKLNKRKPDIIQVSKVNSDKAMTPTQKPIDVIKELIDVSVQAGDTVCDPFMGSGSTIVAIKKFTRNVNHIGFEIDKEIFEKAKTRINEI